MFGSLYFTIVTFKVNNLLLRRRVPSSSVSLNTKMNSRLNFIYLLLRRGVPSSSVSLNTKMNSRLNFIYLLLRRRVPSSSVSLNTKMNSRLNCSSNGLPTTWTYNGKNYSKKEKITRSQKRGNS